MEAIKSFVEFVTALADSIPLALWQIVGCIVATFLVMPFLKLIQVNLWELTPRIRRTINSLITVPIGGLFTVWLYDQPGKDYAIVFIMFSSMGIYKGLTKLSEVNKDTNKLWFLMYYWLRPFDLYEWKDDAGIAKPKRHANYKPEDKN